MALGRLLSGLLSSAPPVACKHAWHPHANERNCTCTFVRCRRCAVVKKLSRCEFHESTTQDKRPAREYFESMGLFDDGIPQNTTYARELTSALEEMGAPAFAPGSSVLEIGSGIGRLVPWFLKGGMSYTALEPDAWAARYIRDAYDVAVMTDLWEAADLAPRSIDVVAAIHCLEHVADADAAFAKMVDVSRRYVLIVIPEGWDIWNPDHLWMFTKDVLRTWGRNMGLRVYGPVQKRVAEPEDTIYALFERTPA
jgi:hypothetical protein